MDATSIDWCGHVPTNVCVTTVAKHVHADEMR